MRGHFLTLTVLAATLLATNISPAAASQAAPRVLDQLTPENSVVVLIDFQPHYAFSTRSTDIDSLVNNAVGLAKAARAFKVPLIATTITAQRFAGPMLQSIRAAIDADPIDRTVINAWHDIRVASSIKATGRK